MATETEDVETWMNGTAGTVFVLRFDHHGDPSRHVQVDSGRTVHLTTKERRINMEKAATEGQDPFRNGILQPVRLLDGNEEESRELASNPNSMSETDMRALLKGHHKTFDARVGAIYNASTLLRMREIAYQEDASIKRVQRLNDRIQEVGAEVALVPEPVPSAQAGADAASYGRPVQPS